MEKIALYDITIFSSNITELKKFYCQFNLPIVHEKESALVVFLVGNIEFAIHKVLDEYDKSSNPISLSFIAEDFMKTLKILEKNNIDFEGPKLVHAGFEGVKLRDPDGNYINIFKSRN